MKNLIKSLGVMILATVIVASVVYATTGSFTPPTGTTANYRTLGDIYAKLTNFNLNPSATHSVSTTTSPAGSFHTLGEIYTLLTDENQDLIASKIATGTVIFGVRGTLETGSDSTLSWSRPFTGLTGPAGYASYVGKLCWDSNTNQPSPPSLQGQCTLADSWDPYSGLGGGLFNNSGITIGAVEYCKYLNSDGTALTNTPNDYWRLPSRLELYNELSNLIMIESDRAALADKFYYVDGVSTFRFWTNEGRSIISSGYTYPAATIVGSDGRPANEGLSWFYTSLFVRPHKKVDTAHVICVK